MAGGDAGEERRAGHLIRRLMVAVVVIGGLATWTLLTGFYQLEVGQEAVILRLGAFNRVVSVPGPKLHLPYPLESRAIVNTQAVLREEFGDVDDPVATKGETVMQTGDNAIVHLEFVVRYRKADPLLALFRVADPEAMVRDAAQAAMREVVARKGIDGVLADERFAVESETFALLEEALASYQSGIEVTQVELLEVQPPTEVREAFDDVVAANQDKNRQENEARAYANQVKPRAEASASELIASAQAYEQGRLSEATGEKDRFLSLLAAYRQAPDIMRKRLYLETMEEVLSKSETIIMERGALLPHLPIEPRRGR